MSTRIEWINELCDTQPGRVTLTARRGDERLVMTLPADLYLLTVAALTAQGYEMIEVSHGG